MHEAKLKKMEMEMKMVFQQKVQEKEQKLKQSEEELYARHREMKEALEKQRLELDDKKRRIESGRPLTPEKGSVSFTWCTVADNAEKAVRSWQVIIVSDHTSRIFSRLRPVYVFPTSLFLPVH